jgi:cytochrome c-type biogenesis protein CcmF
MRSAGAIAAFSLSVFTAAAIGGEFARGSRAYRASGSGILTSINETFRRNGRRYGGYVVHLGIVLMVLGFTGSAFKTERHALLAQGENVEIGSYALTYERLRQDENDEKRIFEAAISVERDGRYLTTLYPQRNLHKAQAQPQSEIAIRTSPIEDLYVVVTSFDADGTAALRAFVNPLTWWIWAGAAVMVAGMLVVLSDPRGERLAAPVTARRPTIDREPDPAAAGVGPG